MNNSQHGVILVEVLIAWAILSTVLLSMVLFQMGSLQRVERAYRRSLAVVQLASLLERLRVNKANSARLRELGAWNQENKQLLPQGEGSYTCGDSGYCEVVLIWQEHSKRIMKLRSVV